MKLLPVGIVLMLACSHAQAKAPEGTSSLDDLLAQVHKSRGVDARRNGERERRFVAEKETQQRRLEEVQSALAAEQRRSNALQQAFDNNEKKLNELKQRLRQRSGSLSELSGTFRQVWGDTKAVLGNSLITTQLPERTQRLGRPAMLEEVPTIDQMEALWFALQQEMTESAKVARYKTNVVGVDGKERARSVIRVGTFNAVADGKFLRHLPETGTLQELSRQPASRYRRMASGLAKANAGLAPMAVDPSRGAVLGALAQMPDVFERVEQGRLIGYVIIAIAIVAVFVVIERAYSLFIIGRRIKRQLASDIPNTDNPLGRVMAVYREHKGIDTETLELKLDEAVLKDSSGLQRGLGTIRILAVIAPMLGLLGTVAGLIETFQSITLFGTGDPKLMAGGISQALMTTVLGLGAAIPLIVLHTALNSKSRRLLSILEEQSAGIIATHAEKERHHAVCA